LALVLVPIQWSERASLQARAQLGNVKNKILTYLHTAFTLILGAGIIGTAHHDLTIRDALEN
jgi:hypothetical protein